MYWIICDTCYTVLLKAADFINILLSLYNVGHMEEPEQNQFLHRCSKSLSPHTNEISQWKWNNDSPGFSLIQIIALYWHDKGTAESLHQVQMKVRPSQEADRKPSNPDQGI